jgi:uncharacterized membrane protein
LFLCCAVVLLVSHSALRGAWLPLTNAAKQKNQANKQTLANYRRTLGQQSTKQQIWKSF